MNWNRQGLKEWVKTIRGLSPSDTDGLLTDSMIHDAIDDAIRFMAEDCNLTPVVDKFRRINGQWEYPFNANRVLSLRGVYFLNDSGGYEPLTDVSQEAFLGNRNPETDTGQPIYYSFPILQPQAIAFFAQGWDTYDYTEESRVTLTHIRTIEDSGANFGRTLDGTRIIPGMGAMNISDDSHGYVEFLDTITPRTTGTATAGTTSSILEDTTKDFVAIGVEVDDIICIPSSGIVTAYAFVISVATTQLEYELIQGATAFSSGDTYKVGVANKVRLDYAAPYRGLRGGARNTFLADSAKATITGTTFTATTCTGSSTFGAEVEDEAIASGGSHGKITVVEDNSITVSYWIGGIPTAGQAVTVRECDAYQFTTKAEIQPVIWIGPTCDESDSVGEERIVVSYAKCPVLPTADSDPIPFERKYERPFRECLKWQAWERTGLLADNPGAIAGLKRAYEVEARKYRGDIWNQPKGYAQSFWRNQRMSQTVARGVRDQVPSGIRYSVTVD